MFLQEPKVAFIAFSSQFNFMTVESSAKGQWLMRILTTLTATYSSHLYRIFFADSPKKWVRGMNLLNSRTPSPGFPPLPHTPFLWFLSLQGNSPIEGSFSSFFSFTEKEVLVLGSYLNFKENSVTRMHTKCLSRADIGLKRGWGGGRVETISGATFPPNLILLMNKEKEDKMGGGSDESWRKQHGTLQTALTVEASFSGTTLLVLWKKEGVAF